MLIKIKQTTIDKKPLTTSVVVHHEDHCVIALLSPFMANIFPVEISNCLMENSQKTLTINLIECLHRISYDTTWGM